jgi:hypothetical protein
VREGRTLLDHGVVEDTLGLGRVLVLLVLSGHLQIGKRGQLKKGKGDDCELVQARKDNALLPLCSPGSRSKEMYVRLVDS